MPLAAQLNQAETRWYKFVVPVIRGMFTLILGWKFSSYSLISKDKLNKNIILKDDINKDIQLKL